MKQKLLNFSNRLKAENESVKQWKKNRPKTPIGDKLSIFFNVLIVVAFVLVFIFSNPVSASASELPGDNQRITHEGGVIPTDLTGYKVSVPAGWSVDDNSGFYDVYGVVNTYEGLIHNVYSFTGLYLGFAMIDGQLVEQSNSLAFGGVSISVSDNSYPFDLNINGGDGASNVSLIQWLSANNATFTTPTTPPSDTTVTFKSGLYNLAGNWYLNDPNFIASLDGYEFETLGGDIVDAWDIIDNKLYACLNYDYDNPLLVAEYFGDGRVEWYTRECSFLWKLYDDNVSSSFASSLGSSFLVYDVNISTEDGFYLMQDAYFYGIEDGFGVGYDVGYDEGYSEGYVYGVSSVSIEDGDTFLGNIVSNILDALDKFTIVGSFSYLDLIKVLVAAFVLLFFLKLLAGG